MPLPADVKPRSKQEWIELTLSTDPADRKIVSKLLRDLGIEPAEYVSWTPEQKADKIIHVQGDATAEEDTKKKKTAAKPAETTKTSASSNGSSGGTVSSASIKALEDKVDQLQATVNNLATLILDGHFLLRVFATTDASVKGNANDEDIQAAFYGKAFLENPPGNEG